MRSSEGTVTMRRNIPKDVNKKFGLLTLKMKAARSSEVSVTVYKSSRRHVQKTLIVWSSDDTATDIFLPHLLVDVNDWVLADGAGSLNVWWCLEVGG